MANAKRLPSGMWRTRAYVGKDSAGKKKYKSFTAPTRRQSEYLAAAYLNAHRAHAMEDITWAEAAQRYMEAKALLSPSTLCGYESIRKTHFADWQYKKLKDLTQELIQKKISELSRDHSPKTVRNVHGFISGVLSLYMPAFRLSTFLPENRGEGRPIPTEQEFQAFLRQIEGDPLEIYVLLAAGSLRRSEIAAVTEEDVLSVGVRVNKSIVKGQDGKYHQKRPKTRASERVVPFPPEILAKFRVFGFPPTDPGKISRMFDAAISVSGLPRFTLHSLRHYYASVMHFYGVPDKYIMLFGGWSTDTVLKSVYQHAMKDKIQEESGVVIDIYNKMTGKTDDTKDDTTGEKT